MKSEIKEKIAQNIKPILLLFAVAFGVLLIAVSPDSRNGEETENKNNLAALDVYTKDIERRLEEIIGAIEGAGKTKVMVSFESSFESVYANNAKLEENTSGNTPVSAKSTEKQIVLAGDRANGETPILLKELCPRVKGVVVVCSGGDNYNVIKSIKEAVSSLFSIPETKVCVTAGDK